MEHASALVTQEEQSSHRHDQDFVERNHKSDEQSPHRADQNSGERNHTSSGGGDTYYPAPLQPLEEESFSSIPGHALLAPERGFVSGGSGNHRVTMELPETIPMVHSLPKLKAQSEVISLATSPVGETLSPKGIEKVSSEFTRKETLLIHTAPLKQPLDRSTSLIDDQLGGNLTPTRSLRGRALYIFGPKNVFRKLCWLVVCNVWFDRFILTIVLINTGLLGIVDYSDPWEDGPNPTKLRNQIVEISNLVSFVIFLCEAAMKIVTMGFALGKGAYLRDNWNKLDFLVLITGLHVLRVLSLLKIAGKFTMLRILRVIRPLRTLHALPGLRILVNSVITALPALLNVSVLLLFGYAVFAILGMEVWRGAFHYRCRLTAFPIKLPFDSSKDVERPGVYPDLDWLAIVLADPNKYRCSPTNTTDTSAEAVAAEVWDTPQSCFWPLVEDDTYYCGGSGAGRDCRENGQTCGSNYDLYGNPKFYDVYVNGTLDFSIMNEPDFLPNLNFGLTSFDNIAATLVIVLQVVTASGWMVLTQNAQDAYSWMLSGIYFNMLLFIGMCFMLQLNMAVIFSEFEKAKDLQAKETQKRLEKIHREREARSLDKSAEGKAFTGARRNMSLTAAAHIRKLSAAVSISSARHKSQLLSRVVLPFFGKLQNHLRPVVQSPHFRYVGLLLTAGNTVVLACDHHPMEPQFRYVMEVSNFIFLLLFTLEMAVKMLGLGMTVYFADNFNRFDFLTIAVGIIEALTNPPTFIDGTPGGASPFTALRAVRVFKLARNWESLNRLLVAIMHAMGEILNFLFFLVLFIYIYALIGMELFATRYKFDSRNFPRPFNSTDPTVTLHRSNFDSVHWAFFTVFQIITYDNFPSVMYDGWLSTGAAAPVYFTSIIVLGVWIVMNMFSAILVQSCMDDEDTEAIEAEVVNRSTGREDEMTKEEIHLLRKIAILKARRARRIFRSIIKNHLPSMQQVFSETLASTRSASSHSSTDDSNNSGSPRSRNDSLGPNGREGDVGACGAGSNGPTGVPPESPDRGQATAPSATLRLSLRVIPPSREEVGDTTTPSEAIGSKTAVSGIAHNNAAPSQQTSLEASRGLETNSDKKIPNTARAGKKNSMGDVLLPGSTAEINDHTSTVGLNRKLSAALGLPFPANTHSSEQNPNSSTPPSKRESEVKPDTFAATSRMTMWTPRISLKKVVPLNEETLAHPAVVSEDSTTVSQSVNASGVHPEEVLEIDATRVSSAQAYTEKEGPPVNGGVSQKQTILASPSPHSHSPPLAAWPSSKLQLKYRGASLMLFRMDSAIRQGCIYMIERREWTYFVTICIAVSCIIIALDSPLLNPDEGIGYVIGIMNKALAVLFTIEMIVNVIALGFLFGRHSYLSDGWRILDFFIVAVSLASLLSDATGGSEASNILSGLRALRSLRALRPLRVINKMPQLKLVVNTLFRCFPDILKTLLFFLFILFLFGVVCVIYFKGAMKTCSISPYTYRTDLKTNGLVPPWWYPQNYDGEYLVEDLPAHDLMTYPRAWSNMSSEMQDFVASWNRSCNFAEKDLFRSTFIPTSKEICLCFAELNGTTWSVVVPQRFDNIFLAVGSLYELTSMEGWSSVAFAAVDSRGVPDMQPIPNNNELWMIFWIFFMIVCAFFITNLFIGVLCESFMRENYGGSLVTEEQIEWIKLHRKVLAISPVQKFHPPQGNRLRSLCFRIVTYDSFDIFITVCILVNMICMAAQSYGQPRSFSDALDKLNITFVAIFTTEFVLKWIAYGPRAYLADSWNKFDITIVLLSLGSLLVSSISADIQFGPVATVVRVFRVGRALRLINKADLMRSLFETLLVSLPAVGNVTSLLMLLFYIYAAVGVQLFATVSFNDSMVNRHQNFQTFWLALQTLIGFATGENFDYYLWEVYNTVPKDNPTCENVGYSPEWCETNGYQKDCKPIPGCGSWLVIPYFYSFYLVVGYVAMNLFSGIVVDALGDSSDDGPVNSRTLAAFTESWSEFDPNATYLITVEQLCELLIKATPPFGFRGMPGFTRRKVALAVGKMQLPLRNHQYVHFKDVSRILVQRILSEGNVERVNEMNTTLETLGVHKEFDEVWKRKLGSRKGTALETDITGAVNRYTATISIKNFLANAKHHKKMVAAGKRKMSVLPREQHEDASASTEM